MAWLEAGVHIKAVADLLGHSSISVTGDIYGHARDPARRSTGGAGCSGCKWLVEVPQKRPQVHREFAVPVNWMSVEKLGVLVRQKRNHAHR